MAKFVTTKSDFSQVKNLFEKISDPKMRESLARQMAYPAAKLFEAEAKRRAPVSEHGVDYHSSRGSKAPGTLRNAIYAAYDKKYSTDAQQIYSVSWNNAKAFYGKFVEFGYFQRYYVGRNTSGKYYTDKSRPLSIPQWVPAQPFLYPAFKAKERQAAQTMIDAGREAFPKLMEGKDQ